MPGSPGKSTADFQDNLETDRIGRVDVDASGDAKTPGDLNWARLRGAKRRQDFSLGPFPDSRK